MKNRMLFLVLILSLLFSFSQPAFAVGLKEGGASLLLPTTGQTMNGQFGTGKTKVMAGVEVAAVTTVALIGVATGGAAVWFGLAPLIANHVWSATDAYKGAQFKRDPAVRAQIIDAQRNVELAREGRLEHEQAARSDIRERIRRASEALTEKD